MSGSSWNVPLPALTIRNWIDSYRLPAGGVSKSLLAESGSTTFTTVTAMCLPDESSERSMVSPTAALWLVGVDVEGVEVEGVEVEGVEVEGSAGVVGETVVAGACPAGVVETLVDPHAAARTASPADVTATTLERFMGLP
jgi:hypothetical protein